MKYIFLFTAGFLIFSLNIDELQAQPSEKYDSVSTYDVNLSSYMTTNGRVYTANGRVITKSKYDFYKQHWESAQNCRPCEVYTYDEQNRLKHIAIQYEDCLIGGFKEFYPSETVKVEGNFRHPGQDWSNLKLRGLCSTREGEWKYYSSEGRLVTIETYENGKVVSSENVKDSEENKLKNKFKGIFKKQSD